MPATVAEHLHDEIRGAISDLGVLGELRNGVHEHPESHTASDPIEISVHRRLELGQCVDRAQSGGGAAILEGQVFADDADKFQTLLAKGDLTRDENQISGYDKRHITRDRRGWRRQPYAKLRESVVDRSRHFPFPLLCRRRAFWPVYGDTQEGTRGNPADRSSLPRANQNSYMTGMHQTLHSDETPSQNGYAVPAEWSPHRRTWMCWPCRLAAWGSEARLERARLATARVARAIGQFEPVVVVARAADAAAAERACGASAQILVIALDDSWARDTGPTFLSGGGAAGVAWQFNAWGGKYDGYRHDSALGEHILRHEHGRVFHAPIVCEGGAIHVDGEGTLITTEQCLLNPNRNPGAARDEIAEVLRRYTGAETVLWLPGEYADIETDGHVDNISCFAAPGRTVVVVT